MFRKIIDSVYDVMVGFREHPLLLCLFIFQIFSGVVYAVSCATETKRRLLTRSTSTVMDIHTIAMR